MTRPRREIPKIGPSTDTHVGGGPGFALAMAVLVIVLILVMR